MSVNSDTTSKMMFVAYFGFSTLVLMSNVGAGKETSERFYPNKFHSGQSKLNTIRNSAKYGHGLSSTFQSLPDSKKEERLPIPHERLRTSDYRQHMRSEKRHKRKRETRCAMRSCTRKHHGTRNNWDRNYNDIKNKYREPFHSNRRTKQNSNYRRTRDHHTGHKNVNNMRKIHNWSYSVQTRPRWKRLIHNPHRFHFQRSSMMPTFGQGFNSLHYQHEYLTEALRNRMHNYIEKTRQQLLSNLNPPNVFQNDFLPFQNISEGILPSIPFFPFLFNQGQRVSINPTDTQKRSRHYQPSYRNDGLEFEDWRRKDFAVSHTNFRNISSLPVRNQHQFKMTRVKDKNEHDKHSTKNTEDWNKNFDTEDWNKNFDSQYVNSVFSGKRVNSSPEANPSSSHEQHSIHSTRKNPPLFGHKYFPQNNPPTVPSNTFPQYKPPTVPSNTFQNKPPTLPLNTFQNNPSNVLSNTFPQNKQPIFYSNTFQNKSLIVPSNTFLQDKPSIVPTNTLTTIKPSTTPWNTVAVNIFPTVPPNTVHWKNVTLVPEWEDNARHNQDENRKRSFKIPILSSTEVRGLSNESTAKVNNIDWEWVSLNPKRKNVETDIDEGNKDEEEGNENGKGEGRDEGGDREEIDVDWENGSEDDWENDEDEEEWEKGEDEEKEIEWEKEIEKGKEEWDNEEEENEVEWESENENEGDKELEWEKANENESEGREEQTETEEEETDFDARRCLECPSKQRVRASKGYDYVPLFIPTPKDKCQWGGISRFHVEVGSGYPEIGSLLREGHYLINVTILGGSEGKTPLKTCTYDYEVQVYKCPPQTSVLGGSVECSADRAWGSKCTWKCDQGKQLIGSSITTCGGDKKSPTWSNSPPQCKKIVYNCSPQTSVPGGSVECSADRAWGSKCTWKCEQGKQLIGRSITTCGGEEKSPTWSNSPPQCKNTGCPIPKGLKGVALSCTLPIPHEYLREKITSLILYPEGSLCHVRCGLDLAPRNTKSEALTTSRCLATGKWFPDISTCCIKKKLFPQPNYGECKDINVQFEGVGGIVHLIPPRFHTMDGSSAHVWCTKNTIQHEGRFCRTCKAHDKKRGLTGSCHQCINATRKLGCPSIKAPLNGHLECQNSANGDIVCRITCKVGFFLPPERISSEKVKCLRGRSMWDFQSFRNEELPPCILR